MGDHLLVVITKDDMSEMSKPDTADVAKEGVADGACSSESSQCSRETLPNTSELNARDPEASSIVDTRDIPRYTEGIDSTKNEVDPKVLGENFVKLTLEEKHESVHKDTIPKPCNTEIAESDDCVTITLKASHRRKIPKLRASTTKAVTKASKCSAQVSKVPKLRTSTSKSNPTASTSSAQVPESIPEDLVLVSETESCTGNKIIQSSKLRPDWNFDIKINPKLTTDREQFMESISSVNSDMVEKSRKLLRKQTFAAEMASYIQASQSVCRLLLPRNIVVDDVARNNRRFDFSSNENFHSIGESLLEQLQLYLNGLKADFRDWEAKRTTILRISENIPKQLELCYSEYSTRVLMHEISTGMGSILEEMNDIMTKIEERNNEFSEIWEGIDGYIKFSSSFIVGRSP